MDQLVEREMDVYIFFFVVTVVLYGSMYSFHAISECSFHVHFYVYSVQFEFSSVCANNALNVAHFEQDNLRFIVLLVKYRRMSNFALYMRVL